MSKELTTIFKNLRIDEFPSRDSIVFDTVQKWIKEIITAIPESDQKYVEIEIKFGKLRSVGSDKRPVPQVNELTVVDSNGHFRINSSVTKKVFQRLSTHVKKNNFISGSNELPNFEHVQVRDSVYMLNNKSNSKQKIRVSRDLKTGSIIGAVKKIRINNLLLQTPGNKFDSKISISLELPETISEQSLGGLKSTFERSKDRYSYYNKEINVTLDLTTAEEISRKNHEIELELNSQVLLGALNSGSDEYLIVIEKFLKGHHEIIQLLDQNLLYKSKPNSQG